MGKGQDLYKEAKKFIPGGTQLLSKRPEMFLPELWPSYYSKAKGCEIWDLDGNKYYDTSLMGIGACILGYRDPDVDRSVKKAVRKGNMSTLNVPEEVELAKVLVKLHPWASMVRYTRTGGEAMVLAVRIARAYSKKDVVLFCGYHGWHDWYLSANLSDDKALEGHLLPGLSPVGVPRALKDHAIPFIFNDVEMFNRLVKKYDDRIGAIILEPVRNIEPEKDFLNAVSTITKEKNIPLIVDEITSGFRLNLGGAHLLFDIEPDIAVFAKSISNGYPMSAIIGKRHVMEESQNSFISSTYWTDRIGPAAALATIEKMQKTNAQEQIIKTGKKIQNAWREISEKYKMKMHVGSIFPLSHFDFEHEDSLLLKTLFTQYMLEKGYIASNSMYMSIAHTERIVDKYIKEYDSVINKISSNVRNGSYIDKLKGPVCHSGFKRLN